MVEKSPRLPLSIDLEARTFRRLEQAAQRYRFSLVRIVEVCVEACLSDRDEVAFRQAAQSYRDQCERLSEFNRWARDKGLM